MLLVSVSQEVILWNSELNQQSVFSPFKKPISRVEWTYSGQALCLLSEDGSSVGLLNINNKDVLSIPIENDCVSCISLTSKLRHLLIGYNNGAINTYDLKYQKSDQSFQSVNKVKVTSAILTESDARVIGCYSNGDIIPFNRSTGYAYSSVHLQSRSPSVWISGSSVAPNIFSTCHLDGTLAVWDIGSMQLSHTYHEHIGPTHRAEFSPINKSLLVSCGLDNFVIFHDIDSQKVINKIDCNSPVTCFSLASEGNILAVGKLNGSIVLYDLRNLNKHLAMKEVAHPSSVKDISFEKHLCSNLESEKENSFQRSNLRIRDSASSVYSYQSSRNPLIETFTNRDSIDLDFSVCSDDFSTTFSNDLLDNLTISDEIDLERKSIGPSLNRQSLVMKNFSAVETNSHQKKPNSPSAMRTILSEKNRVSFKFNDSKETVIGSPSRITSRRRVTQLNDIMEEKPILNGEPTENSLKEEHHLVEDSAIRHIVQEEINIRSKEFDKTLVSELDKLKSSLMSEVIKQLIISETDITSKLYEMLDDRAKLVEENRRLRYENQMLKRL